MTYAPYISLAVAAVSFSVSAISFRLWLRYHRRAREIQCLLDGWKSANAGRLALNPRGEGGEKRSLTRDERRLVMKALDASSPVVYEIEPEAPPTPREGEAK